MATLANASWQAVESRWNTSLFSLQGKIWPLKLAAIGGNSFYKALVAVAAMVVFVSQPIFILFGQISQLKVIAMSKPSILSFYQGEKNDKGVTLEEVWSWDDQTLENTHSFIQWLFPLKEKSSFNHSAAVTDSQTIAEFQNSNTLQMKMYNSLDVMLKFYGFKRVLDQIIPDLTFDQKAKNWLTLGNHNYLRISRILRSLNLHGLNQEARAFYGALKQVCQNHFNKIGTETLNHWEKAASIKD